MWKIYFGILFSDLKSKGIPLELIDKAQGNWDMLHAVHGDLQTDNGGEHDEGKPEVL